MIDKNGWVLCPVCRNKTKVKVNPDTILFRFPLFCPKCRQENKVDVSKMIMKLS